MFQLFVVLIRSILGASMNHVEMMFQADRKHVEVYYQESNEHQAYGSRREKLTFALTECCLLYPSSHRSYPCTRGLVCNIFTIPPLSDIW